MQFGYIVAIKKICDHYKQYDLS